MAKKAKSKRRARKNRRSNEQSKAQTSGSRPLVFSHTRMKTITMLVAFVLALYTFDIVHTVQNFSFITDMNGDEQRDLELEVDDESVKGNPYAGLKAYDVIQNVKSQESVSVNQSNQGLPVDVIAGNDNTLLHTSPSSQNLSASPQYAQIDRGSFEKESSTPDSPKKKPAKTSRMVKKNALVKEQPKPVETVPSCKHSEGNSRSWTLFQEVVKILNKLNAPWALFGGTMLEFVRDCKIGSSDLDFILEYKWWQKNQATVKSALKQAGFMQFYSHFEDFGSLTNDWSYGYPWKKRSHLSSKVKVDFHSGYMVDTPTNGWFWGLYEPVTRAHRCFVPMKKTIKTKWGGLEVNVPFPVEPFMKALYGSKWMLPYKGWVWNREPFTVGSCKRTKVNTLLPPPSKDTRFNSFATEFPPERPPSQKAQKAASDYSCATLMKVPEEMGKASWFPKFYSQLEKQKKRPPCSTCTKKKSDEPNEWSCFRFWYATPHFNYHFMSPRSMSWKAKPRFSPRLPECKSLQESVIPSDLCLNSLKPLFKILQGIVHHPLSGTELAFARPGVGAQDTDIDLFVDVPPTKLARMLQSLSPRPRMSGSGYAAEVHWKPVGCKEVHMQFNDRIADEINVRTSKSDLCSCKWKSTSGSEVSLYCHKQAQYRMEVQYGPTWWLSLPVKQMDMPYWAYKHQTHNWVKKTAATLRKMRKSASSLITLSDVSSSIPGYADKNLVLAQLNLMLYWSDSTAFKSAKKLVSNLISGVSSDSSSQSVILTPGTASKPGSKADTVVLPCCEPDKKRCEWTIRKPLCEHQNLMKLLDFTTNTLKNMPSAPRWTLMYGSLLGAIRNGKSIPNDTDDDVRVEASRELVAKTFSEAVKGTHFEFEKARCATTCAHTVYFGSKNKIHIDLWTTPSPRPQQIGVMMYNQHKTRIVSGMSKSVWWPPKPCVYNTKEYLCPANPEKVLAHLYGSDWRTPIKGQKPTTRL